MSEQPSSWMITRHIPYVVRWKIMQMKLLLADIKELRDKYNIPSAAQLYEQTCREIDAYLSELMFKLFELPPDSAEIKRLREVIENEDTV